MLLYKSKEVILRAHKDGRISSLENPALLFLNLGVCFLFCKMGISRAHVQG